MKHAPPPLRPRRRRGRLSSTVRALLPGLLLGVLAGTPGCALPVGPPTAELVLKNGRLYTFTWGEPGRNGEPASDAPLSAAGWHPDATALAIDRGSIVYVGDDEGAERFVGPRTRVRDLGGATAVPGLVDAHTHALNLGTALEQVDLVGVATEEEAVERVAARAAGLAPGTWIVGYGWDDGAWADRYPDKRQLTSRVPEHPVVMRGLHGFAIWGNQLALDAAGIDADVATPEGGRIDREPSGEPTGLLIDRATDLLESAIPPPSLDQLESRFLLGLEAMAAAGYTAVHEAGLDSLPLRALENLAAANRLPVRVYAMLSARDPALLRQWKEWGPDVDGTDNLITRSVKAYYDGALGSRGARMLEAYSDQPEHFGASGAEYGFDESLVAEMLAAGWQVNIHAIGDAGNRQTLDFFARELAAHRDAAGLRHRIEHAQVVSPADFWRFRQLGLIASMQPAHAVEDKAWAVARIGDERIAGAYAWRTMRHLRVPLVFSSDLPGSDHDPFYGLHSAITRRDKDLQPPGGWFPEQRMSPEEAVRGYTIWAAYASFLEHHTGTLAAGRWADITVMDIDPLEIGRVQPDRLLDGEIVMTIVGGRIVYEAGR